ncbi:MAG: sugar phosphate isomerase/epimerase [Lentisphaeria bacterium]|nr:sugar phosphate isomerase/epimerase [Lentisphaeria bacterium]
MRYAFMSFSCPQLGLDEMLSLARSLGYDGIEPRTASRHAHGLELALDAAGRRAAAARAAEAGIDLCCIATSCVYANPETRKAMVDETLRYIDLAADVGAPCLRVFGGAIPAGVSREAAIEGVAGALAGVAGHADARGVRVCMETHDHWCDPADVAAVMTRVNHPAIRVNWDIMHPVRVAKATMAEAYRVLRPWIAHVHFHDGVTTEGKLRMVPIGQGDIDHRTAVRLLQGASWDGCLSGEWIGWEPHEVHLPRELATMRSYEA